MDNVDAGTVSRDTHYVIARTRGQITGKDIALKVLSYGKNALHGVIRGKLINGILQCLDSDVLERTNRFNFHQFFIGFPLGDV